ncbi:MAG: hypothetical protein KGZ83_12945, partial [Sulfuricella sp.]|nr:hypothetical protein [Sulfuricella sp.]
MSLLSFLQPSALPSLFPQNAGRSPLKSAPQDQAPISSPNRQGLSLSDAGKLLTQQGNSLSEHVGRLGSATVGMAENMLNDFAKSLFGDAQGTKISFDSLSMSASSTVAGIVQRGTSGSAAGFSLEDNSSFVGKGTITTADGHTFNFEVEVRYQMKLQAAVATTNNRSASAGQAEPQAAAQGHALQFPGSLTDLLGLLAQGDLQASFQTPGKEGDAPNNGTLLMRLLDQIAKPQDTYSRPTDSRGS